MRSQQATEATQPLFSCKPPRSRHTQSTAADLTPEYLATLRRMTGAQKLRTAFQSYWGARKVKAARLRQQHPDWSEAQVQQRVKEILMHGLT